MKTRVLLLCAAFIACTAQQANAKIWRVNNNGYSADFAQLQDANDDPNNVVDGDTIHLEGSATRYNSAIITKRLIILGPGYFLTNNPNVSANYSSAEIGYIEFNNTSSGSQAIGIYFGGSNVPTSVNASNILIKRCRFDVGVSLSSNITDIKIIQNYFASIGLYNVINTSNVGFPTDVIFDNNICLGTIALDDNYVFEECNNNIFALPNGASVLKINAGTFYNNILNNPNATVSINNGDVTNVDYNISASRNNQFGNSKNNLIVTDTSTLFVDGTSPDGKYQLKPVSPAIGNGSDGTDRGAFGGGAPQNWYTLSGLAPIPVIYDISSTGVGSTGLPVTIKARTIK